MKLLTIIYGFTLMVLGGSYYNAVSDPSVWTLLPTLFGLLAILFGLLQGRWQHNHPLYGAIMMGLFTTVGSIPALWNMIVRLTGGQPSLPVEVINIRVTSVVVVVVFIAFAMTLIQDFWHHWKQFGHFLGDWVARVALTFFYFTIFVPFGIGVRLFSDPLHIKKLPDDWWQPRPTGDKKLEDVKRQF